MSSSPGGLRALLILHEHLQAGHRLHHELAADFTVYVADTLEKARQLLEDRSIGLLLVSRSLVAASGPAFLDLLCAEFPRLRPLVVDVDHDQESQFDVPMIVRTIREALEAEEDAGTTPADAVDAVRSTASESLTDRLEVFGTAAHDLRNPLTVILSLTELMLHEHALGPEETQQFLEAIRSNADEMHRLLDDVQEIARLESGHGEVRTTSVELGPLLAEAVAEGAHEGVVTVEVAQDARQWTLDPSRMRRALGLLIADAASRASTAVSVRALLERGGLLVEINDDGPMLEPSALQELGESLRRGRRRKGEISHGTGLGPALAARIVEAHGGSIAVKSGSPAGTTLCVRLPMGEAAGEA